MSASTFIMEMTMPLLEELLVEEEFREEPIPEPPKKWYNKYTVVTPYLGVCPKCNAATFLKKGDSAVHCDIRFFPSKDVAVSKGIETERITNSQQIIVSYDGSFVYED